MTEPDPRLALIYEESVRKLDQQASVLEALRGRTGLLLGAGAVSSSFLAPEAIKQAGWNWQVWVGVLCLVVNALLLLLILLPYGGWVFSHKPSILLEDYVTGEAPRSINGMHRWLSVKNERFVENNRRKMARLFRMFELATVLLAVSIVFWLSAL